MRALVVLGMSRRKVSGLLQRSPVLLIERRPPGPRPASQAPPKSTSTLLWWTAALLSVFIVADLVAYLYIFRSVLGMAETAVSELEFRNPYVGLAELYSEGGLNASRYDPIVNIPRVAAQVSSAEPDKVFPEAEHRYLSNFGTMSPNDRHLQVSSSVRIPFAPRRYMR